MTRRSRLILFAVVTVLFIMAACVAFFAPVDSHAVERIAPTATRPPVDLLLYLHPGQRVDILGDCDEFHHVTQRDATTGGYVQCITYGD